MPSDLPNALVSRKGRPHRWRRYINLWPLLVWLAAIFVALWAYRQGVVFRRMNGAVDVYQENVSPLEDGNFENLGPGIARGSQVKKGDIVAIMRDEVLQGRIAILREEIETRRTERLRTYDGDILKVASELRKIRGDLEEAKAEKSATEEEIQKIGQQMDEIKGMTPAQRDAVSRPLVAAFNIKIAKYVSTIKERTDDRGDVEKDLNRLKTERETLATEKDPAKIALSQAAELHLLEDRIKRLTLRATRDGTVDRILKEPGEFVKQGEGILKIVGPPTQIIGFLSQDQLTQVRDGMKVWITPTTNRSIIFDSKILYQAPRMDSLRDTTGPTPTSRIFGRDIICEYPKDCSLLPGQTVIIWIEPPGDVPLLNRWLSNRDANAGK